MGKVIGYLGSMGMLAFISMLFFAFLRQVGAFSSDSATRLKKACVLSLLPAMIYWLSGYLMYCVVYGQNVIAITDIQALFPSESFKNTIYSLEAPVFHGLFSGIFAFVGHWIGKILFGKYLLGGALLAMMLVIAGVYLLLFRAEKILGKRAAVHLIMLLFAVPGAFFLFLPGAPPLIFFLLAFVIYFAFLQIKPIAVSYSDSIISILLVVLTVVSSAVLFAAVTGKLA